MLEKEYLLTPSLLREVENTFSFFKRLRCLYEDFSQYVADRKVTLRVIAGIPLCTNVCRVGFVRADTSLYAACTGSDICKVENILPGTTVGEMLKDFDTLPAYLLVHHPTSSNPAFREYVIILAKMPTQEDIKEAEEAPKHILEIKNTFGIS